jgi:aminopeptidase N
MDRDFTSWAETWLKTAGCNIIWHDIEEEDGKIKKFTINQRIKEHGEGNRLRVQKYSCAFYDENMKVIDVIDIETKDDQETFDLDFLVGKPAPYAYHINY